MADPTTSGLLDLERELTCSICTDILFQPLTLLDCLHTFCGSCLKEWFSWQASQATPSTRNPFTCPSCRASVRETRPNATVTTLLDMYLQANPGKGKSAQEKKDIGQRYKPGDEVVPRIERHRETSEDVEDRRMIDEIRERSLAEARVRGPGSYERGMRHRVRDSTPESTGDESRQRRRREHNVQRRQDVSIASAAETAQSRSRARHIEHQSSLRSLLSNSDVDSSEIEEEILRQIVDEGLLDGINLDTLDISQEDELSERIADAYRRRHRQRSESQDTHTQDSRGARTHARTHIAAPPSNGRHTRSSSAADEVARPSHPPVSRPYLLEGYPIEQGHRRRRSSESRHQTFPVAGRSSRESVSGSDRQAARSATDLSNHPQGSGRAESRPTQLFSQARRTTDPQSHRPRNVVVNAPMQGGQGAQSPRTSDRQFAHTAGAPPSSALAGHTPPNAVRHDHANDRAVVASATGTRSLTRSTVAPEATRPSSSPAANVGTQSPFYKEPSITCERCGRPDIQYELHKNCSTCHDGKYNVCLRCYRLGNGCLRWLGFGYAALYRFEHQPRPSTWSEHDLPHTLASHRYLRPLDRLPLPSSEIYQRMTTEDPKKRLQIGPYCSNCSTFAADCFWECDSCNEGDWGYCNRCVTQGKCCSHPLLPFAHSLTMNATPQSSPSFRHLKTAFFPLATLKTPPRYHFFDLSRSDAYIPLTISKNCNICTYPIQPSNTRFHCFECDEGDYDICTTCYLKLVATGHISKENGDKGWRRCLHGHRMVIIGFEDSASGQRRIVVKDLVGGYALKDDGLNAVDEEWSWRDGQERQVRTVSKAVSAAGSPYNDSYSSISPLLRKYPPDGGVGLRVRALWSYWPEEGVVDELAFPKGAEIREVEDINRDWFWGCYAGRKGLFPGNYVKVLDVTGR